MKDERFFTAKAQRAQRKTWDGKKRLQDFFHRKGAKGAKKNNGTERKD
jgi:hypothetical protein